MNNRTKQAFDDALMDFYLKVLKPEFDAIKYLMAGHDRRFDEIRRMAESAEEKHLNLLP